MVELTGSQKTAEVLINKWIKSDIKYNKPFLLGGPAGTGKTWLIRYLIEKWGIPQHKILVMAYTGQAVSVLRRRGVRAFTIYSQIMDLKMVPKTYNGEIVERGGIPILMPKWEPVEELGYDYDLIIIEESSFVNTKLSKILTGYGIPVLFLGDHAQLDPVTGESFFVEENLDFALEDVMRQLLDSDLLRYLTALRRGEIIKSSDYKNGEVYFLKAFPSHEKMARRYNLILKTSEMLITATNKQRNALTDMIRKNHYLTDNPIPVAGERMICRKNRWNYKLGDYPLVNGTIGYNLYDIPMCDVDTQRQLYYMDFQPKYIRHDYFDHMACDLEFLKQPFGDKDISPYRNYNLMEYGSAISVQLSQGDQYKSVSYFPSWNGDINYKRKCDYTAASRAEETLYVFV